MSKIKTCHISCHKSNHIISNDITWYIISHIKTCHISCHISKHIISYDITWNIISNIKTCHISYQISNHISYHIKYQIIYHIISNIMSYHIKYQISNIKYHIWYHIHLLIPPKMGPQSNDPCQTKTVKHLEPLKKNRPYFPLHWLFNRDPYKWLIIIPI